MPFVEISLTDIISYLGNRNKPLIDGERNFKAGHVVLCGLDSRNTTKNIKIIALCLQTSALSSPPHQIDIVLNKDVDKWKCECSCIAGKSGFCKHVVAVLIYVNRHEKLDEVSCTEITQAWGKEKKALKDVYGPVTIRGLCHPEVKVKHKGKEFTSTGEIDKLNLDRLINYSQNTAISKFFKRHNQVKSQCSNHGARRWYRSTFSTAHYQAKFSEKDPLATLCEHMKRSLFLSSINRTHYILKECCQQMLQKLKSSDAFVIAQSCGTQGSQRWKKERQLRITGSKCYSIYTFADKEGWTHKAINYFWPKSFTSKYTEHGKKYEKEALQNYKESLQKENQSYEIYTPAFIVCEKFPWLGYSPDAILFEKEEPIKLVEIKCPFSGKERSAETFIETCEYLQVTERDGLRLKEKHPYYGQIQLGMAILNLPSTDFILYSPSSKSFLKITVEFNETFTKTFIEHISYNYFTYMLHEYCKNKDKFE